MMEQSQSSVSEKQIQQLLEQYELGSELEIKHEESGLNNTTRFIYAGDRVYVLRVYENHRDADKVMYEHAIMRTLADMDLPFHVPAIIPAASGSTYACHSNGKLAVLFAKAEGRRPMAEQIDHAYLLGKAAGHLVEALAKVKPPVEASYLPYYEIYEVHHLMTRDQLFHIGDLTELKSFQQELETLLKAVISFEKKAESLRHLPMQIVHSDLVFSNALIDGNQVTLLDFEFATVELRAMELAVTLSEFLQPDWRSTEIQDRMSAFLKGYIEASMLSLKETEALHDLVKLRLIVVFIHFMGRYLEGLDSLDQLQKHIYKSAWGIRWLDHNQDLWQATVSLITQREPKSD
ncbi:hypothetical protein SY83_16530 [Paenibacillus swuensis]|uniref:Aminoglycoside phosphotransferase domain-containing protein n=1 Tax=Paenibacillus swuensis TaxID=1178515 RepID=A0A172TLH1_9BACL|nr:phosphotransferase [Paenibacillus swuensis]ANE47623.1 hypothetical protein SY83_16530 [Paenibacillus swuensis]